MNIIPNFEENWLINFASPADHVLSEHTLQNTTFARGEKVERYCFNIGLMPCTDILDSQSDPSSSTCFLHHGIDAIN